MELDVLEENNCYDMPDNRDYPFDEYIEFAEWIEKKRPYNDLIVYNQWATPACTRYALMHIVNAQNIIEYKENWQIYEQIDPITIRTNWNKIKSLQSALSEVRRLWLIEWSAKIFYKNETELLQSMKKAIDMWMYIYTGSSNGDWAKIKQTGIYTIRTDWKFVWHAWDIIDYDDTKQAFKCINSYWNKRWLKWYFRLPYPMITKIYSKYPIIDKDDSWKFQIFKDKQKAKQVAKLNKELYTTAPNQDMKDTLHETNNKLRLYYDFTDKEL